MKIFCSNCGYEVPAGSNYCLHCRNRVTEGVSNPNYASTNSSGFRAAGNLDGSGTQSTPNREMPPSYNNTGYSVPNTYNGDLRAGSGMYGNAPVYREPMSRDTETVNPNGRAVGVGEVVNDSFVDNRMMGAQSYPQNNPTYYNGNPTPVQDNMGNIGSVHSRPPIVKMRGMSNMIIYACVILISTLFLPIISFREGIMPDNAIYFMDVLEGITDGDIDVISVDCMIFWISGICSVMMLISALCKSKVMCIVSSVAGTVGVIGWLAYLIDRMNTELSISRPTQSAFELLCDFDTGLIAYGFWFILIIFVISFISSLTLKRVEYHV